MSTRGRTATADATGALAGAVREAGFVHLVAAADGDALAAAGLLARGCRAADVPFQASVARTDAERERRLTADDPTVLVGGRRGAADHVVPGGASPSSVAAHAVATDLGADPEPTLALAGASAAGVRPGTDGTTELLEAADAADAVEQRPGVALPIDDVADGLAHQTLVHADFAGDAERATELVRDAGIDPGAPADADDGARQRLASLVALEAAGDERATRGSAESLERALRPYATPDGPFASVGGHADVHEALARTAPGLGVALAVAEGTPDGLRERALEVWRDHGRTAHEAVRSSVFARHDGLVVARIDDGPEDSDVPVGTVARLLLTARSPEPAVLVACRATAAAAATPGASLDVGDAMRAAADAVGGDAGGDSARAYATHDGDVETVVSAFREGER